MTFMRCLLATSSLIACVPALCMADQVVKLAHTPSLSPDGRQFVFEYGGDIWQVATAGGRAIRLTTHAARDTGPLWSPDGKRVAFTSNRTGATQTYVMPIRGGDVRQLTFHTEGSTAEAWFPDSEELLVSGSRDHFWRSSARYFRISSRRRSTEQIVFDAYAGEASLMTDGSGMLLTREGERWWRKGYHGERSAQIWRFSFEDEVFTELLKTPTGNHEPVALPDSDDFLYAGSQDADNGARNLWRYEAKTNTSRKLTHFDDDVVSDITVSGNGKTVVFRHLFDLYSLDLRNDAEPKQIKVRISTDDLPPDESRVATTSATDAAFTQDGLEMALIAGGDVWVMDTQLREPVAVTSTAAFESAPVFSLDHNALYFISDDGSQTDIWKAERADPEAYWWRNTQFKLTKLTDDHITETSLQLSPDGEHLAVVRDRGDLWLMQSDGSNARQLVSSFSAPDYDFSPDGKWIVYANSDDNFNQDIWIVPVDGHQDPVNVSRHPDDDSGPKWSPDGKLIAFSARRVDDEIDIYYVWLRKEDEDTSSRDRKLRDALEKIDKARKKTAEPAAGKTDKPDEPPKGDDDPKKAAKTGDADAEDEKQPETDEDKRELPEVVIDFEDIHRRLHRISIPNSSEENLFWSADGKQLAFTATVDGARGTYRVTFPDELTPKKLSDDTGSAPVWSSTPDRVLWLVGGVPASTTPGGATEKYSFRGYQTFSRSKRFRAGFVEAWQTMRDWWYDDHFGNHDWNQIREKYEDAAAAAPDRFTFGEVIHLMLGELNGSHLGFSPSGDNSASDENEWNPVTAHLGVRFDLSHEGPGLRIRDVIPNGPATRNGSRLHAEEIILKIDGKRVDRDTDLTRVLNGRPDRDITLLVSSDRKPGKNDRDAATDRRTVTMRPVSYAAARAELYQHWIDHNRQLVETQSKGRLGYLHIRQMNWSSFLEFEKDLFDAGYGREGLVIDVRDNGGGSTTDHLLTALTQPRHAITVPRGGGPGYPQSRMVYATWNKPIVVMCNQNSYSNAEIFSHAIRNLGRGKLVGVQTAGGVISTGARQINDLGMIRLPFRGWFVAATGEDMELNGAMPHVTVRVQPAQLPAGVDPQIRKAVQVLLKDVNAAAKKKRPELIRATERE